MEEARSSLDNTLEIAEEIYRTFGVFRFRLIRNQEGRTSVWSLSGSARYMSITPNKLLVHDSSDDRYSQILRCVSKMIGRGVEAVTLSLDSQDGFVLESAI